MPVEPNRLAYILYEHFANQPHHKFHDLIAKNLSLSVFFYVNFDT